MSFLNKSKHAVLIASATLITFSCDSSSENNTKKLDSLKSSVIETYSTIALEAYKESYNKAVVLQEKIDAFVAQPSDERFTAAKTAWLDAREPYGQTEVFRFYEGPIDNETNGPEGDLNAWPLEEGFIDYVDVYNPQTRKLDRVYKGIVSSNDGITAETIKAKNGDGGESNVSVGYHAIEFLLWGHDWNRNNEGATDFTIKGRRPYTDFLNGDQSTAENGERRGAYLKLLAQLLVSDLKTVVNEWEVGKENFREAFKTLNQNDAFKKILTGMGKLSHGELAGERIATPLENPNTEHEHSCFSDNTHRDIILNAKGISNVFYGTYGAYTGKGLYDLVLELDKSLAEKMKIEIDATTKSTTDMITPFDFAINDETARTSVENVINKLRTQALSIVVVGEMLGFKVNTNVD